MRRLGIDPPQWKDGTRIVEADMQTYALPRYPGDDYLYKHLDYGYPIDTRVDTNGCIECHDDCELKEQQSAAEIKRIRTEREKNAECAIEAKTRKINENNDGANSQNLREKFDRKKSADTAKMRVRNNNESKANKRKFKKKQFVRKQQTAESEVSADVQRETINRKSSENEEKGEEVTGLNVKAPLVSKLSDMKSWTKWFYGSNCCMHCLHPTGHDTRCKLHDDDEEENDCRSKKAKKALLKNCFRMEPLKRIRFYINWFNKYGMKHALREDERAAPIPAKAKERCEVEIVEPNTGGDVAMANRLRGEKAMTLIPEEDLVSAHLKQTQHGCFVLTNKRPKAARQAPKSPSADFRYGKLLPRELQGKFTTLITQFQDVCATDSFAVGRLPDDFERVEFKLKEGAKLPKARAYRLNAEGRKEVDSQVRKLLAAGLVVESNSPYASPCFVVAKPDGSWRFVIAYMQLNAAHDSDTFPLPRIEKLIEATAGKRVFSAIDLKSAYWHIPIPKD